MRKHQGRRPTVFSVLLRITDDGDRPHRSRDRMKGTTGGWGTKLEARPNDRLLCRCHCDLVMMTVTDQIRTLYLSVPGNQRDPGPLGRGAGVGAWLIVRPSFCHPVVTFRFSSRL